MPIFRIDDNEVSFPPVQLAEPDGLLAIGGDLSVGRLLEAYRNGIFPWYESGEILWWSPHPRFVLFPGELKITKSVKALEKMDWRFSINEAFPEVIRHCRAIARPGQEGTWITDEVEEAYIRMHTLGYAHSAEIWEEQDLIGGLYGIRMGQVFFGESMFSKRSNASRLAFIKYLKQLQGEGVQLIDCQVYTEYLESFGARMIGRAEFSKLLTVLIPDFDANKNF